VSASVAPRFPPRWRTALEVIVDGGLAQIGSIS
jgi:hypothetical protein